MAFSLEKKPLVLLIEDEAPMRKFISTYLTSAGCRLLEANTGQQALLLAAQSPPDLVILDLGLPDIDGQNILRILRQWLKAPIIVLSARSHELQKITALDHGADDYLTKPFSTGELLARIRAALRRAVPGEAASDALTFESGNLKIDLKARRVLVNNVEVRLTPIEYKLLTNLARNSGQVLTHDQLLNAVWGPERTLAKQHLRVFMAGLRRKIEENPAKPRHLLTEQGVGYRLAHQTETMRLPSAVNAGEFVAESP